MLQYYFEKYGASLLWADKIRPFMYILCSKIIFPLSHLGKRKDMKWVIYSAVLLICIHQSLAVNCIYV